MDTFFTEREIEGRREWIDLNMRDVLLGKKTIHFTDDPYEAYDFDMTASTTYSYGEIKTIHRDYSKYPNFQIDYRKLKTLQDKAREDNRVPYLVCFFDDVDVVWNISSIDLESRKYNQFCTSTTAEYTKGKKEKEEVWLTIEEAIYKNKKIMFNS